MMHAAAPATPSRLNEYYELCKPRVVMLIVFTAVVGMFLAVPGLPPWGPFVWGTLGIGLQASSAAAIVSSPISRFGASEGLALPSRSEEHTSEPQSLMRTSYAVSCLINK